MIMDPKVLLLSRQDIVEQKINYYNAKKKKYEDYLQESSLIFNSNQEKTLGTISYYEIQNDEIKGG